MGVFLSGSMSILSEWRNIKSNYKSVLSKLEAKGMIVAQPKADTRRKRNGGPTFGDSVVVTFPQRGNNNGN